MVIRNIAGVPRDPTYPPSSPISLRFFAKCHAPFVGESWQFALYQRSIGRIIPFELEASMSNQDQRAIFITGASSGLGRATAKLFASKGWKVSASMRDPKREKELGDISGLR